MRVEVAVTIAIGPREASAVAGRPLATSGWIVVKRPSGRPVCRTVTGTRASTAGWIVAGCSTLAPNAANSAASAKESSGTGSGSATTRGSADSTPSTSVQIWTSSAASAAPSSAAE